MEPLDRRWAETQGLFGTCSKEECLLPITWIITVKKKTEREEITGSRTPSE